MTTPVGMFLPGEAETVDHARTAGLGLQTIVQIAPAAASRVGNDNSNSNNPPPSARYKPESAVPLYNENRWDFGIKLGKQEDVVADATVPGGKGIELVGNNRPIRALAAALVFFVPEFIWHESIYPYILVMVIFLLAVLFASPLNKTKYRRDITSLYATHPSASLLLVLYDVRSGRLPPYVGEILIGTCVAWSLLVVVSIGIWNGSAISQRETRLTIPEATKFFNDAAYLETHAEQFVLQYTNNYFATLVVATVIAIWLCLRLEMAQEVREVQVLRRQQLNRVDNRLTGLIDSIRNIARSRMQTGMFGSFTSAFNIGCMITGLLMAFLPIWGQVETNRRAASSAPGLFIVYFLCLLVAVFPCLVVLQWCLMYIGSFYWEGIEFMKLLAHSGLDLTVKQDLRAFLAVRQYFLKWELPVSYSRSGSGFGAAMLLVMGVYAAMIALLFQHGNSFLYSPLFQLYTGITTLVAVHLVSILAAASSLWERQAQHIEILEDAKLKLRLLRQASQAKEKDEEEKVSAFTEILTVKQAIRSIQLHDPAPHVLGIPVKPTLLRLVGAYLVSAASIVASKVATG